VFDSAAAMVKSKHSSLLDKMTKNIGFAMGIEFREGALLITNKSAVVAKKGNVWIIQLMIPALFRDIMN